MPRSRTALRHFRSLPNKLLHLMLLASLSLGMMTARAEQKVTVFAAASLTNALTEIASVYEKTSGIKVISAYAASSALAKQIEHGAPADVFISADLKWMQYLQDNNKIQSASRRDLLANQLVLIAPRGKGFKFDMDGRAELAQAFDGRLCTGDVDAVPAGIYAKQALQALSWWQGIKPRIVGTQDVRAALNFVERGECAAGIVYATDARVSQKVETVSVFPAASHAPIVYPVALTANAQASARGFVDFLGSPAADAIFIQHGFTLIKR